MNRSNTVWNELVPLNFNNNSQPSIDVRKLLYIFGIFRFKPLRLLKLLF